VQRNPRKAKKLSLGKKTSKKKMVRGKKTGVEKFSGDNFTTGDGGGEADRKRVINILGE